MNEDKIEEFDNLMQAGLDEVATDGAESDIAIEYFTDAAFVLNSIEDSSLRESLATKYEINPLDYAQ